MKEVPGSDSELIQRLRSRDESAFRTVYTQLQGQIFRFALHMSGSRSLAEDVVQETFLTLIHKSDRFDPDRGSLAAFVVGIGRKCLLRRLKHDRPLASIEAGAPPDPAAESDPLAELRRSETVRQVREAVLSLPLHYREVVVLCDLQERSYDEAAELLNCAAGTVRSRLHRARALLSEKLRVIDRRTELSKAKARRCLA